MHTQPETNRVQQMRSLGAMLNKQAIFSEIRALVSPARRRELANEIRDQLHYSRYLRHCGVAQGFRLP